MYIVSLIYNTNNVYKFPKLCIHIRYLRYI